MQRVLIVIPTHNESYILAKNIRLLHAFCVTHLSSYAWRLHIADNGSNDTTPKIAAALSHELPHVTFTHTTKAGRGGALSRVWGEASDEILMYMDADLAAELTVIERLLEALHAGADIAIGSRFVADATITRSWLRECSSRVYNSLARMILSLRVRDTQCGCKAITKKAAIILLPEVHNQQWFFDTELLFRAEHHGMRIAEVPVAWVEVRDAGRKSSVRLLHTIVTYCVALVRLRFDLRRL